MKIQEINLEGFRKEAITVCLIQLQSPFDEILETTWRSGGHVFSPTKESERQYAQRLKRLSAILERLSLSGQASDLIVLPEYSFLKDDADIAPDGIDTLARLISFAESTKTIMVGNYYDITERESVTFVAVPSAFISEKDNAASPQLLLAPKLTRSRFDSEVLRERPQADWTIPRLVWTPNSTAGRSAYIQTLTCKDYLYFTSVQPLREHPEIISLNRPGIIICPACTPEIHSFETRAMSLVRDVDVSHGDLSVVTCICNSTSLSKTPSVILCGQSQIVSPRDIRTQLKPIIRKGIEGCAMAEINPFHSYNTPTPVNTPDPGSTLLWSEVLHFTSENGGAHTLSMASDRRKGSKIVINPDYLAEIGMRRVYGFLRCANYHEFRKTARIRHSKYPQSSIAIHGIYGIHDVLAGSWEEFSQDNNAREFIKMRLWPMATDQGMDLDDSHFGCCIVQRFWKYRGVALVRDGKSRKLKNIGREDNLRTLLKSALSGDAFQNKAIDDLLASGVLLRTECDCSDLSTEESNLGFVEYLILVKLIPLDVAPHRSDARGSFERHSMPRLIEDTRVRTIEEIRAEGLAYLDADYVLHVVGELSDLNDIVLDILHAPQAKNSDAVPYACGTRVVFPAETITPDRFPALGESSKQPATEPNIVNLIKEWKDIETDETARIDVFLSVIYLIPEEALRRIIQAYFLTDRYADKHRKDVTWMRDFFSFAYAVSCAISPVHIHTGARGNWIRMSSDFIAALAREVEGELERLFSLICKFLKIENQQFDDMVNVMIKVISENEGRFSSRSIELGTCGITLSILAGASKESKVSKIKAALMQMHCAPALIDGSLALMRALNPVLFGPDCSKELKGFSEVRNSLVHYRREGEIKGSTVLEGAFFGLRMLDRCDKVAIEIDNNILEGLSGPIPSEV